MSSDEFSDNLDSTVRHLENVQRNCRLLGERLIDRGEHDLGRLLIANGFIHDNSKFYGVEWNYLHSKDQAKLDLAVAHHNHTNPHHPEYWGSIHKMPELFIAEMVCDWGARASEFGTSLREWISNKSMQRYKYTKEDKVYEKIIYFVGLLCDQPFS